MIYKATTVKDTVKSFPTHNIKPIKGRPTYHELKVLIKGLHSCSEAIPSHQAKGHLYMTTSNNEYHRITGEWKDIPRKPSPMPSIDSRATQFQIV